MHKHVRQRKFGGATGFVGKTIVQGILERGGEVRCTIIKGNNRAAVEPGVRKHVEPGSTLYTDALWSYRKLNSEYAHEFIDHAVKYVEGKIHTNGIENFWSLLKRMLKGTSVATSSWQLFRYLDEEAFRFNQRKTNDSGRFGKVMESVVGKRLMYCDLVECRDLI